MLKAIHFLFDMMGKNIYNIVDFISTNSLMSIFSSLFGRKYKMSKITS